MIRVFDLLRLLGVNVDIILTKKAALHAAYEDHKPEIRNIEVLTMRALLAFLAISSASAFCQQNDFPPYPGYPNTEFAPKHDIRDFNLDVIAMGNSLSPLSYRPRSYAQFLEDNKPRFVAPPVTANPIKIRDAQGRLQGTIQTRPNGTITFRDNRGRVTQTGTVRAGTITLRDSKSGSANKAK